MEKKVIYISGPVSGVKNYWEKFEKVEDVVSGLGYTALTPTRLPEDLSPAQRTRICQAMIDASDAVIFLAGWSSCEFSNFESYHCEMVKKPRVLFKDRDQMNGAPTPESVTRAWLEHDLGEVFKNE